MIDIRRAELNDNVVIALLGRVTFREAFAALFARHESELRTYLDRTFSPAKIAASLGKADNRYWITSIDGLPIGYAKLKVPSPNAAPDGSVTAQVQKIYILAEFAAQRAGSALMQEMMTEAAKAGATTAWLNVLATNERAIRFYLERGWTRAHDVSFEIGSQSLLYLTLECSVGMSPLLGNDSS